MASEVEACIMASTVEWATFWVTLIGVITAVGAIIAAWVGVTNTIKNDRDIAKKTKTLEVILEAEISSLHEDAIKTIREYGDNDGKTIAELGVHKKQLKSEMLEAANQVYAILNWYEYMAVGVRNHIICEETLRNASYSTIIDMVGLSEAFILEVRKRIRKEKGSPDMVDTAFEAVCWLVDRWKLAGYTGPLPPIE